MKKIFLFILLSTSSFLINAQTIKSIGLKVGRSNAKQEFHYKNINVDRNTQYTSGFYSAINLELFSKKYLSLVSDFSYCQKGYRETIPFTSTSMPEGNGTFIDFRALFQYISFSPLLKIRKENKHFIPYGIIGPRVDYQIKNKDKLSFANSADFKKLVFGLTGGAGLEYKFKQFGMGLEFQIQYDLTKIIDTQASTNSASGVEIKNFAMVMAATFKYYLNN